MTDTNELPQESKALSTLPAQLNNPPTPKSKSISDQLIPVPQSPMPRTKQNIDTIKQNITFAINMYGTNGNLLKDNVTPFLADISKYIDIDVAKASENFKIAFTQTEISQSEVEKWLQEWNGMSTNISTNESNENAISKAIFSHKKEIE